MKEYIILLIAIIVHEFGHLLGYWIFGFKPNIKLNWYGVLIGQNIWHTLKPFEGYIISLAGITIGLIPLWLYGVDKFIYAVYMVMCSIDIVNILGIMSIDKKYRKLSLLEINEIEIKELRKNTSN